MEVNKNENKKISKINNLTGEKAKNIAMLGVMIAMLEGVKSALNILPNVELVTLLIILFTIYIGKSAFIVVAGFVILECFIWGIGIWTIGYIYIWPILVLIVLLLKNNKSTIFWSIIAGMFGLCFGALFSIIVIFTSGIEAAFSYWMSGLLFDIIHCVSNFILTMVLFPPLYRIMGRIYRMK